MKCPKGHIVINTTIHNFVYNENGCFKCNRSEPWTHRREEFKRICEKRNYILITDEKGWKEGTKKDGNDFKPRMKCPKGHIVIDTSISNFVNRERGCPKCINKTETNVLEHIENKYGNYKITHQFKQDWCKNIDTKCYLPFDICIEDLKIIIEIDGDQHFTSENRFDKGEEKMFKLRREKDLYKIERARDNGYNMIRLYQPDVWDDTIHWKQNIDDFIYNIKNKEQNNIPLLECHSQDTKKYDWITI